MSVCGKNADQNNSEYGFFLRSVYKVTKCKNWSKDFTKYDYASSHDGFNSDQTRRWNSIRLREKQPPCSVRKDILSNFAKATGKHLRQSLFFNEKKRLWYRYFPVNLTKFLRTASLQNTSGRLLLLRIIKQWFSY